MKTAGAFVALSGALLAAAAPSPSTPELPKRSSSSSLQSVTVKGNAFWAGSERFYIRGVDYQPGGSSNASDPIADAAACKRDVAKFKDLGLNTIRVYTVDNTADHDECMGYLADAGIYLALDVNTPLYSLNRDDPAVSYNAEYLQSLFATIDKFQGYSNTLLFFSGNEVINDDSTTSCAPYVKAVTRDMKSYINARGYRDIPVGYSAADVDSNRYEMAAYMNCGEDAVRSDFFAFNDYSWCDPSSYTTSGWNQKVEKLGNYSIPIFLSEYGCITNTRKFEEVSALYNTEMTGVYSGGLVYEYSEEGNNYGLVTINGDGVDTNADYTALKTALAGTADPSGDGGYKSSGAASTCPTKSSTWNVTISSDELPAFPSGANTYLKSGAGKGPGLEGKGSQNSGGSTALASAAAGAVTSGAVASGTGSASKSKGAAAGLHPPEFQVAPIVCGLVVLFSSLLGGSLIL